MKKYKYLAAVLGISMVLTMAGCGKKQDSVVEATPTPEATAAPTAVPVTVTPVPTSTPAPKVIGVKTYRCEVCLSDQQPVFRSERDLSDDFRWGRLGQELDSFRVLRKGSRAGTDVLYSFH